MSMFQNPNPQPGQMPHASDIGALMRCAESIAASRPAQGMVGGAGVQGREGQQVQVVEMRVTENHHDYVKAKWWNGIIKVGGEFVVALAPSRRKSEGGPGADYVTGSGDTDGSLILVISDIALVKEDDGTTAKPCAWCEVYSTRINLFPVNLTKDGGADGNDTTQASWTYTAKSLDNTITYDTGLTPEKQRPAVGTVTNGDGLVGLGYIDNSGTFHLFDANEVKTWELCA